MKRKGTIAVIASTLMLASCGTSGEVTTVDEVVDPLASTPWACVEWETTSDDHGTCEFEFAPGTHAVHVTDNPEMLAAVKFDDRAGVESVAVGDNWLFTCDVPLVAGDCDHLAGLLGGELIEPGHWSN